MSFFKRNHKDYKTDTELIKLYQQTADLVYLGELYERYSSLVYGISLKYLKDREESKDAVMQVFEKLILELNDKEIKNFKAWLHVVAKNYCLMCLRSNKAKGINIGFNDQVENENSGLQEYIDESFNKNNSESLLNALENAIGELPDEQKLCIDLFFMQNKSYKEISDITGFELKKIKSYIQNGKRNMKMFIENATKNILVFILMFSLFFL